MGSLLIALLNKRKQKLQSIIKNRDASMHKGTVGYLKVFKSEHEPGKLNSFLTKFWLDDIDLSFNFKDPGLPH